MQFLLILLTFTIKPQTQLLLHELQVQISTAITDCDNQSTVAIALSHTQPSSPLYIKQGT